MPSSITLRTTTQRKMEACYEILSLQTKVVSRKFTKPGSVHPLRVDHLRVKRVKKGTRLKREKNSVPRQVIYYNKRYQQVKQRKKNNKREMKK